MSFDCTLEDLSDHEKNNCYYPKGGISAAAILLTGHGITDFSSSEQTQAAILDGKYKIISPIKANIPEPTVVEGENVTSCGPETIVDGFDFTIEIKDFNVNDLNDEFYRLLNLSKFAGMVVYMCEEDQIRVVERAVNFVARPAIVPESNKEKQHYLVTAKWSQPVQDPFPKLYEAPVGVF